jgi:hypothetical protein
VYCVALFEDIDPDSHPRQRTDGTLLCLRITHPPVDSPCPQTQASPRERPVSAEHFQSLARTIASSDSQRAALAPSSVDDRPLHLALICDHDPHGGRTPRGKAYRLFEKSHDRIELELRDELRVHPVCAVHSLPCLTDAWKTDLKA